MKNSRFIKYFSILFLLFLTGSIYSQDTLVLKSLVTDASDFAKVKLFFRITDRKGDKVVSKLDEVKDGVKIEEKTNGKKIIAEVQNFYSSDEGFAICFVIDVSASMNGSPLENVKTGLLNTLKDLRAQDKIAIAYFVEELTKTPFATDREATKSIISNLETQRGLTNLSKCVIDAVNWINNLESPKRKVLVIISDGDDSLKQKRIDDAISTAKKSDLTIYTIGSIAENIESKGTLVNMRKIAESTRDKGGEYFRINKPDDIKEVIQKIYSRIKEEYVATYWSCSKEKEVQDTIKVLMQVKKEKSDTPTEFEFSYSAKSRVQDSPILKCKKMELLIGGIVIGVILLVLIFFLVFALLRKRKFRLISEDEKRLREMESAENQSRYDGLQNQYEQLINSLESQKYISDSDKNKIKELERKLEILPKEISGTLKTKVIDKRRSTMILSRDSSPTQKVEDVLTNAQITIKSGSQAGEKYTITQYGVLIGRQEGQIIIKEDTVSRRHAKIYSEGNLFYIEDLGSANGTFVNGTKVTKSKVKYGDTIKVGNTELYFSK
jgi:Mg-chelatase subunit ChlD